MARPQPPRLTRRALWIILGGVAAVLLLCGIGGITVIANAGKNTSNNSTTASSPSPAATSQSGVTPTTTPAARSHKIGDTVNFQNEWQVMITKASLSNGELNQSDPTPEAGKTYLIIEGTFKNLSAKAQTLSTLLYFDLSDAQGNGYYEVFLPSATPPDSSAIEPDASIQGKWPYEVPTSAHSFTLAFDSDLTGEPITWAINV